MRFKPHKQTHTYIFHVDWFDWCFYIVFFSAPQHIQRRWSGNGIFPNKSPAIRLRAHRMFGWKGCNWLIHFNILSTLSVLFHLFTFVFLWLILFITWTEICNDVPLRRTSSFLQWIGNVTLETDFKLDSSFICFYFCIYSWSWTLLLLDWKLTRRLMRGIMNTLLIIKLFKLKLVIYFNVGAKWHVAVFSNDKLFVFKYSDKHWTQVCKY